MKKLLYAAFVVLVLSGCATPATQQAMIVDRSELSGTLSEKLKGQISIGNVSGGKETNPLWTSQVDSATFKAALENSLTVVGYRSIGEGAKYRVDAVLENLDQPLFGLTFDVKSTVSYRVKTQEGSAVIPIVATGSASTSDAFVGIERLRIANERSIKENIKAFIKAMSDRFGR